jgi:hypothetical protein
MAWEPSVNTIDTSQIESNIWNFIRLNQTDSLEKFSGGSEIPDFVFLEDAMADTELHPYPSLEVAGQSEEYNDTQDLVKMKYEIEFESMIYSDDAAELKLLIKKYANALKSMLANIKNDLVTGMDDEDLTIIAHLPKVTYGSFLSSKQQKAYFQSFRVSVSYDIYANS